MLDWASVSWIKTAIIPVGVISWTDTLIVPVADTDAAAPCWRLARPAALHWKLHGLRPRPWLTKRVPHLLIDDALHELHVLLDAL